MTSLGNEHRRRGQSRQQMLRSLIAAIYQGNTSAVDSLIRSGASVNASNKHGTTPLYLASVQGEREIVALLLSAGADPNQESKGESDGTPLCAAASWGRIEIVEMLLNYGADPNLVERQNE